MTIDIIDLTSTEYSSLNAVQLAMVRAAQSRKDKILARAEEEKQQLKLMMIANGVGRASVIEIEQNRMDEEADKQVAVVKEDLLYQLAYEGLQSEGNDAGPYRYPENPNYNLTPAQRFLVVRNYYMTATDDASARLSAYAMDTLAREYLGEYYQTLYELLASYV